MSVAISQISNDMFGCSSLISDVLSNNIDNLNDMTSHIISDTGVGVGVDVDVMNDRTDTDKNENKDEFNYNKYIEEPWTIIESYFNDKHLERLVRHQIESYNNFIDYQLIKTIEMFSPVKIVSEQYLNKQLDKYSLELYIYFENFHMYRPQIYENNGAIKLMFPQEARLRNFTYSSAMTIDINCKIVVYSGENLEKSDVKYKLIPTVHIGKMPIMLKSNICVLNQYKHLDCNNLNECKYDAGGYFIINGSEKTVLGQERAAENKIYCFNISKTNSKYSWTAEIKSIPDNKCISPKQISLFINSKNNGFGHPIYVQLTRVKQHIPLFILFRALGVISDKEICEYILLNFIDSREIVFENNTLNNDILEILQASIIEANDFLTRDDSIKYISNNVSFIPFNMDKEKGYNKKKDFTIEVLKNDLFPHCSTNKQKIYFLGLMTNKLIRAKLGYINQDDRDSFINKRVDLTGYSMNNLFRNYFNKVVKDMEKHIIREMNTGSWRSTEDYMNIINQTNIYKIIKSTTIENGFKRALATGDFGIKFNNSNKVGVAQVLSRLTYPSTLSHLRRISTPLDKSGKLIPPRKLHGSSWGYFCPVETPEGQSVGVVKNISFLTHITIYSHNNPLYDYIEPFTINIESLSPKDCVSKVKIFINGCWIGITDEPVKLYAHMKNLKYKGIINIYTSIVFNYKTQEIYICNELGRPTRPLLRVKDNKLLLNKDIITKLSKKELLWDDLLTSCKLEDSIIEYIDADEQEFCMIATQPKDLLNNKNNLIKYTHCEIHPSTIFGITASCIPFPDFNQSPRNTYQSAQGKQALGIYALNYHERMDKTSYILTYPSRPLVDTRIMNIIKLNEIPSGFNCIVAIATYTGYNQEDSLLVNKGSIDRGLFVATIFHTEKDEDKQKINGDDEIRCKPDKSKTKGMKYANYDKVNEKGLVEENTLIENRDIIISKVFPIKENKNDHTKIIKYEDQSRIYRTNEETYIDKNYIDRNGNGYTFAKVRLRTFRKPVIGDKFSSRMGQKGTIGLIIPEEDMPFTSKGIRPDIIINPHAIPSRMTIGQLKEMILCKVIVELGLFGDGTSFGNLDVETISQILLDLGHEAYGNDILYNGETGEQIECKIFNAPVFYQRLKHMVCDKQHSRSIGPMVNLTRQPAEGRSRDGGLRFGEMERDAMISHGASRFTKGRMYDSSDKYSVHICKKCGMIASFNDTLHIHHCRTCDNRSDFSYVEIPYACKLLFQELITMNIAPRIITT